MFAYLTQYCTYLEIELAVIPQQMNLPAQILLLLLIQIITLFRYCWDCKARACSLSFLTRVKHVQRIDSLCLQLVFLHFEKQTFNYFNSFLQGFNAFVHHAQSLITAGLVVIKNYLACIVIELYFMILLKLNWGYRAYVRVENTF